ncbi:MAG: GNAT family N-acetyltransferase [Candidatus ainarchaeum sp.]|nr:GNAT family N-acetyltransferase [Candidatus ainarchaeum sp.]
MYTIRKANLADLDSIVVLWKGLMAHHRSLAKKKTAERDMVELAPDAERRWRLWARKNMRSRNGLLLVAEEDGKIIGYSLNNIKSNVRLFKVKKYGYLSDIFVAKTHRKRGIGNAFLKAALGWFRKKRMRYAAIAYRACNRQAGQVYSKWGFHDNHVELVRRL